MTQGRYRFRQRHIRVCAPETSSEDLAAILEQDGCLVLNNFLSSDQVDAIDDDLKPFVEATMRSNSEFGGFKTTRTVALMARSPNALKERIQESGFWEWERADT